MKKSFIAVLAAAILVAAVVLTAGCVSNADPIVGSWMAQDSTTAVAAVFENDGSGSYFYVSGDSRISETDTSYSESSSAGYAEMPLRWKAEGNNVYSVVFANGDTGSCTLNPQNETFVTNNDVVYEKVPSGVLGTSLSDRVVVYYDDPDDPGSSTPQQTPVSPTPTLTPQQTPVSPTPTLTPQPTPEPTLDPFKISRGGYSYQYYHLLPSRPWPYVP